MLTCTVYTPTIEVDLRLTLSSLSLVIFQTSCPYASPPFPTPSPPRSPDRLRSGGRQVSGAPESRSEVRAEAGGRRLQTLVGLLGTEAGALVSR